VQLSTKVELLINLKAAKALGVALPISSLGRADEAGALAGSSRQAHLRTPALELAPSERRSRRLSAISYPPKAT
jgi:hypothetical protein